MNIDLTIRHLAGEYPIYVEPGSLYSLGKRMTVAGLRGPVGIITHPHLNDQIGEAVRANLMAAGFQTRTVLVPDGERFKKLATAEQVINALLEQKMERNGTILALGGGVIGDLAGFVAAIIFRGVNFVQVPTSLLAMVDASVGGKTAVNHPRGKNLVGAFHQPQMVLIDPELLSTLSERDRIGGFAEMLKMGLIRDAAYVARLQEAREAILGLTDLDVVAETVARSCELKAQVVELDEREQGLRRTLNFGHTIGHAIERTSRYGTFRHGEAVLLGMYGAAWISNQLKHLGDAEWRQVAELLKAIPLEQSVQDLDPVAIEAATHFDKKVADNRVHFILLKGIGATLINDRVPIKLVQQAVQQIKQTWSE